MVTGYFRRVGSEAEEMAIFAARVAELGAAGKPVCLCFGAGPALKPVFLNIDRYDNTFHRMKSTDPDAVADSALAIYGDIVFERFLFDFADKPWPIPDNCVDYIFHEDFIEHINQKQQISFLAESLRVMKPGAWHRVNTPCLLNSMKTHSRFAEGARGVYTGEWENWEHVSLYTRSSLEEQARLIGYREVVFNQKNQSVSPYRCEEVRPASDRDAIIGNIFADLLK